MNISEERENELLMNHAPLGIPVNLGNNSYLTSPNNVSNQVLLVNEDYLTGKL